MDIDKISFVCSLGNTGTVPTTTPGSLDPTAVRPSPKLPGCPTIITRDEWGAMPPSHAMTLLTETPKYVFIHHGATSPCSTQQECSTRVRSYQTFHMSAPPAGRGIIKICFVFNFDNVYYILVVFSLPYQIKCIKYGVCLSMTYEFDRPAFIF